MYLEPARLLVTSQDVYEKKIHRERKIIVSENLASVVIKTDLKQHSIGNNLWCRCMTSAKGL